jgi:hypothetical protein
MTPRKPTTRAPPTPPRLADLCRPTPHTAPPLPPPTPDSPKRYGEVTEVRIITDRDSGMCKGFAFLSFSTVEAAQAAKHGLDGYRLEGKVLVVRTAGAKDERPPMRHGAVRGPMGPFGGPPPPPGFGPPPGYGPPPPGYGPPPPPGAFGWDPYGARRWG